MADPAGVTEDGKGGAARLRAAELQERLGIGVSAGTSNDWLGAYAIVDFDSLDRLLAEVKRLTREQSLAESELREAREGWSKWQATALAAEALVERLTGERDEALDEANIENARGEDFRVRLYHAQNEVGRLSGLVAELTEALAEEPSKWSFDTLLTIAELILARDYPPGGEV